MTNLPKCPQKFPKSNSHEIDQKFGEFELAIWEYKSYLPPPIWYFHSFPIMELTAAQKEASSFDLRETSHIGGSYDRHLKRTLKIIENGLGYTHDTNKLDGLPLFRTNCLTVTMTLST